MSDVICISSSDDEDDSSKKKNKKVSGNNSTNKIATQSSHKRKLSLNLSGEDHVIKRHKSIPDKSMVILHTKDFDKDIPIINSELSKRINEDRNEPSTSYSKKPDVSRFSVPPNTSQQSNVRKVVKPLLVVREKVPIPDPLEDVFISLLKVCAERKSDELTKKIIYNLKRRYDQIDPIEKKSDAFRLFLNSSIQKISNTHNDKFYVFLREVQDEIKRRIKKSKPAKSEVSKLNTANIRPEQSNVKLPERSNVEEETMVEEIELSKEDRKKVRTLEKVIKKCQDKIKELETQEVNFDDEEDSTYIQEDRYKRKLVELCEKLSEIVGDSMLKRKIYKRQLKRKDIPDEMTGLPSVDEAIIKFINADIRKINRLKHIKKPTAIADFLTVPDYPDILQCISKCNSEKNLDLNKKKMEQLAKTAFKSIGHYLKKQRIRESEDYISSFLDLESRGDPASKNSELQEKLQKNKKEGDKKLNEIFAKYVDKQEGLSPEDLEKEVNASHSDVDNDSEEEIEVKEDDNIVDLSEEEDKDKETDLIKKTKKDIESNKSEIGGKSNDDKATKEAINSSTVELNNNKTDESDKKKNNLNEENIVNSETNLEGKCINDSSFIKSPEPIATSKNNISINKDIAPALVEDDDIEILSDHEKSDTNNKSSPISNKNKKEEGKKVETLRTETVSPVTFNTVALIHREDTEKVNCETKEKSVPTSSKSLPLEITVQDVSSPSTAEKGKITIISDTTLNHVTSNSHKTIDTINDTPTEEQVQIGANEPENNELEPEKISETPSDEEHCVLFLSDSNNEEPPEKESVKENTDSDPLNWTETIDEVVEEIIASNKTAAEIVDTTPKENPTPSNPAADNDKSKTEETSSFIKVRSFAKPPDSWKDSLSPDKRKQNFTNPIGVTLQQTPRPECVDLTIEKESRLPSTQPRIINPIYLNRRRLPVQKLYMMENTTNSYNVSLPTDAGRGPRIVTTENIRVVNPQIRNRASILPKRPNITITEAFSRNHNQRSNAVPVQYHRRPPLLPKSSPNKEKTSNRHPYIK